MTPPRVDVRIGELVLWGIPSDDRTEVGLAFCRELERLLGESELPAGVRSPADITELRTAWAPPGAGADPSELGELIAQTIYGSLATGEVPAASSSPHPLLPTIPPNRAAPGNGGAS